MMNIRDCDPAYPALCYLADRFELNMEQRYWLAFLYQATYCVPTVYYIYNEFPDYENVDTRRLERWWQGNKHRLLFQTDRAKVKNFDKFVPMFESYRELMGESQEDTFLSLRKKTEIETYDNVFCFCGKIYYVGRYSLFLYLESINRLTGLPMQPSGLELKQAESCRNGLCYALGHDNWVKEKLNEEQFGYLQKQLKQIVEELTHDYPELPINYWNVETSLCAYKKLYLKRRYLGYYIDRIQEEIIQMEKNVPEGVDWQVLWDWRQEYFRKEYLGECKGHKGVRSQLCGLPNTWLRQYEGEFRERVPFRGGKKVYQ